MSKYWWIGPVLQIPVQSMLWIRGNWTPRFPRAWRGRGVTVCYAGHTYKLKMQRISRDHFAQWDVPWLDTSIPPRTFYFKDEGLTWCMGWSGKQVDALRVAAALTVLES